MLYRWQTCELAGPMLPGFEEREIAASLLKRAAPPEDVFCYPLVETWRDRIWGLLDDVVTDAVRARFVEDPPEYVVSDDLGWLDDIIFEVTGCSVDIKNLMALRLAHTYRAFRAAHGARTNDLGQYYTRGLRRLRADEVEDMARLLFLNGQFRYATEARLQAAIEELAARDPGGGREGRLYFCADEAGLLRRAGGGGHYLVYGSEYLYCLGMRIVTTSETQRALKAIGRPTVFVCDIPMNLMRDHTLREFGGMVLEYLFCSLCDDLHSHALSVGAGSALSLVQDLPAEHIVGHYHPASVHDPLARLF